MSSPFSARSLELTDAPELSIGYVQGARAWNVDALFRLRSPSYKSAVWRPGVNVKDECNHSSSMLGCSCGFYAFFSEENESTKGYASKDRSVVGVVRGTGETVIGTQGFRSEKAEVIALYVSGAHGGSGKMGFWSRLMRWIMPTRDIFTAADTGYYWSMNRNNREREVSPFVMVPSAILFAVALVMFITALFTPDMLWAIFAGPAVILPTAYMIVAAATGNRLWRRDYRERRSDPPKEHELVAGLAAIYPNVPIYGSKKRMFARHPLSRSADFARTPERKTPDNTPNFWDI